MFSRQGARNDEESEGENEGGSIQIAVDGHKNSNCCGWFTLDYNAQNSSFSSSGWIFSFEQFLTVYTSGAMNEMSSLFFIENCLISFLCYDEMPSLEEVVRAVLYFEFLMICLWHSPF